MITSAQKYTPSHGPGSGGRTPRTWKMEEENGKGAEVSAPEDLP